MLAGFDTADQARRAHVELLFYMVVAPSLFSSLNRHLWRSDWNLSLMTSLFTGLRGQRQGGSRRAIFSVTSRQQERRHVAVVDLYVSDRECIPQCVCEPAVLGVHRSGISTGHPVLRSCGQSSGMQLSSLGVSTTSTAAPVPPRRDVAELTPGTSVISRWTLAARLFRQQPDSGLFACTDDTQLTSRHYLNTTYILGASANVTRTEHLLDV